jgi:putative transcriptional regulator
MDPRHIAALMLAGGLLSWSVPCVAQSVRPDDLAKGKILITPRDAPDPLFSHSVIFLARYDKTGALGLMIHFRSNITISRALAGIKGADKRNDTLFVGGPVRLQEVLALLRSDSPPKDASSVSGKLYLIASEHGIESALAEKRRSSELRIFLGYTGWGPGQLDHEVRLGGWYIFDYDERLVFDDHPETLWSRLIEKTGLQIVLLRQPRIY